MPEPLALCDKVLGLIGREGEAIVTVQQDDSGLTRFANSAIHQHVGEATVTVALTLAVDGRVATSETTRTGDDDLRRLVDQAREATRLLPVDPSWAGLAPPAALVGDGRDDAATHGADPRARAELAKAFIDAGPGMRAAGFVDTSGGLTAVANSAGQRVAAASSRATVDGIHQTEDSAGKGHQTALGLGALDSARVGQTAARLAGESARPREIEPGRYEVVLSPECLATMVQFLAEYGFNAKSVEEGQSFAVVGEAQFDAAISLRDDATDERAIGLPFDAEGTPKARLDLVERGVTAALAHDRRTARQAGTQTTGHAVPGGEVFGAFPSNVFVEPGERTFDQMVASLDRGLVVTEFNYCRVLDPKTQVVTGLTRNGTFLVERGEVVGAVKNLRFTQSFLEALGPGNVKGIEATSRFADGEFGPGMVTAPAVHLAEWNFTGGARG